MRYIWKHLTAFAREDFSPRRYMMAALWTLILIVLNYSFSIEDDILAPLDGTLPGYGLYLLLYGGAYVPVLLLSTRNNRKLGIWALVGLLILTWDCSWTAYRSYADRWIQHPDYFWFWKMAQQLQSLLTTLVPLLLLYPWLSQGTGFYGLRWDASVKLRPYLLMLAIMVLPVALAATTEGFQQAYPSWARVFHWPEQRGQILTYELAYGWDFVATELMFRGFFVVALARLGGTQVVLPATVMYCALHFGKPLGECISSIFGGYILSALAYRTQNIWGGVIVHIGIAFLMDFFAVLMRGL
ncbi:CPBP family intramembrane glutamic endopeptidase [Nostoc sp. NIES-2111]